MGWLYGGADDYGLHGAADRQSYARTPYQQPVNGHVYHVHYRIRLVVYLWVVNWQPFDYCRQFPYIFYGVAYIRHENKARLGRAGFLRFEGLVFQLLPFPGAEDNGNQVDQADA